MLRRPFARRSTAARLVMSLASRALVPVILMTATCASSLALEGCKRSPAVVADDASVTPPFAVTESSEGLLLTWIDEKGDFHVEQKVSDVPLVGRDAVRVLDPTHEEGTHDDRVFVADLRAARPDGTYPVHAMTRAEFDAMAVTRRAKNAPTLEGDPASPKSGAAGGGSGAPGSGASGSGAGSADETGDPQSGHGASPATRPAVIIYGASWCGACHDAAAYLKRKGIPFVEKDVETDAKASQEMRSKLTRAGLRGGSIPVLDVRGRVMVGFNPREVDDALGQAL